MSHLALFISFSHNFVASVFRTSNIDRGRSLIYENNICLRIVAKAGLYNNVLFVCDLTLRLGPLKTGETIGIMLIVIIIDQKN